MTIDRARRTIAFGSIWAAVLALGCFGDPRNVPKDMPEIQSGPFEAYGQKIDEQADAQAITRVWAKAITDFVDASQKSDKPGRNAALAILGRIAAADTLMGVLRAESVDIPREAAVYRAITMSAAACGYYVHNIELDKMRSSTISSPSSGRQSKSGPSEPERMKARIPAAGKEGRKVLLVVDLRREQGAWRVLQVLLEPAGQPSETTTIRVPVAPAAGSATQPAATR